MRADGRFAETAGSVVAPDRKVLVVAPQDREEEIVVRLARIGFKAGQPMEGGIAGQHRSPLHGLSSEFADYRTYTLGAGAYWTLFPFGRGFNISTSVRYWPTVATSLRDDVIVYANTTTARDETHRAANIGIANTPLIINVSLGYVFDI